MKQILRIVAVCTVVSILLGVLVGCQSSSPVGLWELNRIECDDPTGSMTADQLALLYEALGETCTLQLKNNGEAVYNDCGDVLEGVWETSGGKTTLTLTMDEAALVADPEAPEGDELNEFEGVRLKIKNDELRVDLGEEVYVFIRSDAVTDVTEDAAA